MVNAVRVARLTGSKVDIFASKVASFTIAFGLLVPLVRAIRIM